MSACPCMKWATDISHPFSTASRHMEPNLSPKACAIKREGGIEEGRKVAVNLTWHSKMPKSDSQWMLDKRRKWNQIVIRSRVPPVFIISTFLPFSRLAPYLLPSLLINLIPSKNLKGQQEEEGGGEGDSLIVPWEWCRSEMRRYVTRGRDPGSRCNMWEGSWTEIQNVDGIQFRPCVHTSLRSPLFIVVYLNISISPS